MADQINNSGNMLIGNVIDSTVTQSINEATQPKSSSPVLPVVLKTSVFLSYRRMASLHFAPRLAAELRTHIAGEVFIDVDSIQVGQFPSAIVDAITRSHFFCLVISPGTLNPKNLARAGDWVHQEVALALRLNKRIVQVAEDQTPFGVADQLPADLSALANYNGVRIHHDAFGHSVKHLIEKMQKSL